MTQKVKVTRFPELKELLLPVLANAANQQELADWCSVSQAAVSDWVNGYKRPSPANLALLAAWEKATIDPQELAKAAQYEPDRILPLYELLALGQTSYSAFLESQTSAPELINKIWFRGDPELAIDEATIRIQQIDRALDSYSTPKYRYPLLRLLSKLWFERSCAYWVSAPISVSSQHIQQMAARQYWIAEELNHKEPLGWAFHGLGNVLYGLKNYQASRGSFRRALRYLQDDAYRRPLAARTVALNSAYLKDEQAFKEDVAITWRMLDEGNATPITQCIVLEGIARGEALLGNDRSRATLAEGWSCLEKAERDGRKVTVPRIQLLRSEVEASLSLKDWDKAWIEDNAQKGQSLAEAHSYKKYAANFEEFLRSVVA